MEQQTSNEGEELDAGSPGLPDQEVDLWWGSYAGRTMLAGFIAWGAVSLAILAGALLLWLTEIMDPYVVRYSTYALLALIWLVQLGICLYRILTWNYRLTTRHLFVERSFFPSPFQRVELVQIAGVNVDQSPLVRFVGVGRVRISTTDGARVLVLEGVRDPNRIAGKIRKLVSQAKTAGTRK